jgi:VWFA-related protein
MQTIGAKRRLGCWHPLLQSMVFLLFAILPMLGQQPPTFSVKVEVVNVLASVRDKHGAIVHNLTKDDFYLKEDGHPQTVRYFSLESDLPLNLGLLVDTSMSQKHVLDQERSASHSFLERMLSETKDTAFIFHFDLVVELLQDVTSSRQKLEAALGLLQLPELTEQRRKTARGGTLLYDALYLVSNGLRKMKREKRNALIILSDGVDQGSEASLEDAVEAAQRADTLVFSILFKDDLAYGPRKSVFYDKGPTAPEYPNGKEVLKRISTQTGGHFFEVSKKQPIEEIYKQIEEELRNQYSLGYTPGKASSRNGYHKIHLATRQKGLAVQTRNGYYSKQ